MTTIMPPSANKSEAAVQQRYPAAILVVDDEPGMRNFLQRALTAYCSFLEVADNVELGEELRKRYHFDLMIVDIRLAGSSGVEWLQNLRDQGVRTDVIFMTAYADLEMALRALRIGASDFIIKPFRMDQMITAVQRCLERRQIQRENFLLRRQVDGYYRLDGMIGQNPRIQDMCQIIRRVAPTPSTILIEGETGTGKELVARAIHDLSGRRGAFVALNCGSISPELLESELFGHIRGAFTNAHNNREGLFSYAQEGTLFLDEIGEMPLAMQTKLLRALEHKTIRPVGSDQEIPVDTRVIAATNRHLTEEIAAGHFREDLYYRLNVLTITVPPLRDRLDDLPMLASHFSETLAAVLGVPTIPFTHEDFVKLQSYDWPGNVRELKNVIERSLLLGKLPNQCFPEQNRESNTARNAVPTHSIDGETCTLALDLPLDEVEKYYMLWTLERSQGNKSEAARRLGISRKTLDRKLQAWQQAS